MSRRKYKSFLGFRSKRPMHLCISVRKLWGGVGWKNPASKKVIGWHHWLNPLIGRSLDVVWTEFQCCLCCFPGLALLAPPPDWFPREATLRSVWRSRTQNFSTRLYQDGKVALSSVGWATKSCTKRREFSNNSKTNKIGSTSIMTTRWQSEKSGRECSSHQANCDTHCATLRAPVTGWMTSW